MIQEDTLIGEGTTVGVEGGAVTCISHSVIGRNCKIGKAKLSSLLKRL